MSTNEMPFEVKVAVVLRDHLEVAARELTELLKERTDQEFKEKEPIESRIPNFDPEDLMKHDWKGKKLGKGEYEAGSLNWGWDFSEKFKPETIKVLEDGKVLTIGKNEFILLEKIVQTKKVKGD